MQFIDVRHSGRRFNIKAENRHLPSSRGTSMKKIQKGFILPSAALTVKMGQVRFHQDLDKAPEPGDLVYGRIIRIGEHSSLENALGRIHKIHDGTRAVFVFGNRYAPDYYEGIVPSELRHEVDLLARSGVVGIAKTKNSMVKDPTRVRIRGYVCGEDGSVINTRSLPLVTPKRKTKKKPRSKMILVCGTSMNSGKSMAAAACCWALSAMGHGVRASKVTGTAGLKDILHMNDAGAYPYSDFSFLGYPSTYLLSEDELLSIFNRLDLKYANDPKNYWVVELADGVIQRETDMLLRSQEVLSRVHKLIFCAGDAFGAIGGLRILAEHFHLEPDALSGICSSSPLRLRELAEFTHIPVFDSAHPDLKGLAEVLLTPRQEIPHYLHHVA